MVEAQKEAQILKMALKECSPRVKYCVPGGYWHLATPAEVGGTNGHLLYSLGNWDLEEAKYLARGHTPSQDVNLENLVLF